MYISNDSCRNSYRFQSSSKSGQAQLLISTRPGMKSKLTHTRFNLGSYPLIPLLHYCTLVYLSQQACCQCYSCNLDFPSVSISLYGFFLFNHPQTHTPPHAHTHTHKHTILNLTVHICPQFHTHYYCTSKCYRAPSHPYTPPFSNFWNSTAHCASPPHLPLSPQASLQPPPTPNGTLSSCSHPLLPGAAGARSLW